MRVAFLYNEPTEDPALVAADESPARSPVVAALGELGHLVVPMACTLDLADLRRRLERESPDIAFNRVESLGGSDAMMAAVPLLLETLQIPYTGCSSAALAATASKVSVKERLVRAELPTPPWATAGGPQRDHSGQTLPHEASTATFGVRRTSRIPAAVSKQKYLLKSVFEHSSFELDESSITQCDDCAELRECLRLREAATGRPFFAERFVEGREFNLSVVGPEARVLPPAEIDFSALPPGMAHIVGHRAKCDAQSFAYHHTPRRFEFTVEDRPLVRRLSELTQVCAGLFQLDGYARVDFRVDVDSEPWILEINSNPCLSPEAGFAAALAQTGYTYTQGIDYLLQSALSRAGRVGVPKTRDRSAARRPITKPRNTQPVSPLDA